MQTAVLILHIVVCLILVILVLLQAGREGMGVIFGGSGNSSVFGSSGAGGILVKLTAFLATLFVITSLTYNIMTSTGRDKGSSVLNVQFEESVLPPTPNQPIMPQQTTEPIVEPNGEPEMTIPTTEQTDTIQSGAGAIETVTTNPELPVQTSLPVNSE